MPPQCLCAMLQVRKFINVSKLNIKQFEVIGIVHFSHELLRLYTKVLNLKNAKKSASIKLFKPSFCFIFFSIESILTQASHHQLSGHHHHHQLIYLNQFILFEY